MGYAFISYSTKNQQMADSFKTLFKQNGIETWMAPGDIPFGSTYTSTINRAIKGASCFVLLLSESAQDSQWVLKETERAVSTGKTIFTVMLDDVPLNDDFEFMLSTSQAVAIRKINKDDENIKRLLQAVMTYTGELKTNEYPIAEFCNNTIVDEVLENDKKIDDEICFKENAIRVYVENNDCEKENKTTREMKIETVPDNNISQKGFFRKLTNAMRKRGVSDSQLETYEDLTPKKNESEKTNLVFGQSPENLVGKRIDGRYVIKEMICNDKNGVVTYFAQDEVTKIWMHNRKLVMYFISDTYRKQWNEDGLSDEQIKKEVYGLLRISKEKICKLEIGDRCIYLICDEEYLKYNTYEELLNKYAGNEEA